MMLLYICIGVVTLVVIILCAVSASGPAKNPDGSIPTKGTRVKVSNGSNFGDWIAGIATVVVALIVLVSCLGPNKVPVTWNGQSLDDLKRDLLGCDVDTIQRGGTASLHVNVVLQGQHPGPHGFPRPPIGMTILDVQNQEIWDMQPVGYPIGTTVYIQALGWNNQRDDFAPYGNGGTVKWTIGEDTHPLRAMHKKARFWLAWVVRDDIQQGGLQFALKWR